MPASTTGSPGGNVVERRSQQPRREDGAYGADDNADEDRLHRAGQDQPHHLSALRAQRHADPNLARPLRNDIAHHTVHTDDRQRERQRAKRRDPVDCCSICCIVIAGPTGRSGSIF